MPLVSDRRALLGRGSMQPRESGRIGFTCEWKTQISFPDKEINNPLAT